MHAARRHAAIHHDVERAHASLGEGMFEGEKIETGALWHRAGIAFQRSATGKRARSMNDMDFDGFGIGGDLGESKKGTADVLDVDLAAARRKKAAASFGHRPS